MVNIESLLDQKFLGNTIESYLWFIGILGVGLLFKKLISKWISRLMYASLGKKKKGVGADVFISLLTKPVSVLVVFLTLYLAFDQLTFPSHWNLLPKESFGIRMVIFRLFEVAIVASVTWILLRLIDFTAMVFLYRASLTESRTDDQFVVFAREIGKVLITLIGFFTAIAIGFNLDVVSLITGLGIGGLAFALAAKESLENLLASFTIFLDKSFKMGDNIKVGAVEGVVESVGIRTTRVRSSDKTLVIVPNKKMIDAELVNEDDRQMRRVVFTIGLTYDARGEQILSVVRDIRTLLDNHSMIAKNFQVSFRQFSASSLDIYIQYFITQPEFEKYLEVNEEINLRIMEIVQKHNCRFAFPSTRVYVENQVQALQEQKENAVENS